MDDMDDTDDTERFLRGVAGDFGSGGYGRCRVGDWRRKIRRRPQLRRQMRTQVLDLPVHLPFNIHLLHGNRARIEHVPSVYLDSEYLTSRDDRTARSQVGQLAKMWRGRACA